MINATHSTEEKIREKVDIRIGYPGMYSKVILLDVASMHPHSAIKLKVFGPVITKRFENLVEARISIKHIKEIGDDAYNNAM